MQQKNTFSILAIVFAGVSLLFLPIVFGPAALVLGIIGTVKKEKLGVLGLVLGIVLPIIGFVIGFVVAAQALSGY
jgi:uncharacterized membrane protein HdeD (DUF308 family)